MRRVFLSLGGNKGDRLLNIQKSIKEIGNRVGKIVKVSDVYESKSWGYEDNDYLNVVVETETLLSPLKLLEVTQDTEKKIGRNLKTEIINNKPVYRSREIDIDILFYGSEIINFDNLTIPHPFLHLRRFVMLPLLQTAPDFIHPVFNEKISVLYENCKDEGSVVLYNYKSDNFKLPDL